ncbi:hypothetical protein ACO0RG_003289 [Hanseniaspora osmophila]|uniref:Ribosomal protein n=1 Tax=Hanseniaspora osmophila TaxID=56408 RepID=A0A1E5RDH3_9ASCO|nr:54S ribosomal protein RTC6, mitochondrial [Hanseniaspora osmophila]
MFQNQLFKLAARLGKPSTSRLLNGVSHNLQHGYGNASSLSPLSMKQRSLYQFPTLARTFKVKTAVKKMCPDCYLARRKGRLWVYCRSNPKHKQKQA